MNNQPALVRLIVLTFATAALLSAQSETTNRVSFELFLSTSNEVPPVPDIVAGGSATISFLITSESVDDCVDDDMDGLDDVTGAICTCTDDDDDGEDDETGAVCLDGRLVDPSSIGEVTSASVDFLVNYSFGADEVVTAMHIHRGKLGENGPVVVNSGIGQRSLPAGSGTFFQSVELVNSNDVSVVEQILANPDGYYLNVHTQSKASGLIRGQLRLVPGQPGGGGAGGGGSDAEPPSSLLSALSTIQNTLNQMRIENAAHRQTTERIASRMGILPVDPTEVNPEELPPVEDCEDSDEDGEDDETGAPCLADGDDEDDDF